MSLFTKGFPKFDVSFETNPYKNDSFKFCKKASGAICNVYTGEKQRRSPVSRSRRIVAREVRSSRLTFSDWRRARSTKVNLVQGAPRSPRPRLRLHPAAPARPRLHRPTPTMTLTLTLLSALSSRDTYLYYDEL